MIMKRSFSKIIGLLAVLLTVYTGTHAQQARDKSTLVQVTGVVKMSDSSEVIPYMAVYEKNLRSGTMSNDKGLFSLLAHKGDTIVFSHIGFTPKEIVIPAEWDKNFYTTTQYFEQDTFMLEDYIVRAYMKREDFDYAMRYKDFNPDINEAIKEHTSRDAIAMMMKNMPMAQGEGAAFLQREAAYQNAYLGQQMPIGLFNPFKWAEFYKAVQRGDYSRKKR